MWSKLKEKELKRKLRDCYPVLYLILYLKDIANITLHFRAWNTRKILWTENAFKAHL